MLDPALVRDNLAEIDVRLRTRGLDPTRELADLSGLEADRRRLIPLVENLKRDQNAAGELVARAKKAGRDPSEIFAESKARAGKIREHEAELGDVDRRRDALLLTLPNLPHTSVPVGKSSADNVEIKRWGTPRAFDFTPKMAQSAGQWVMNDSFGKSRTKMSGASQ